MRNFNFFPTKYILIWVAWAAVQGLSVNLGCSPLKSSLHVIIKYSFKGKTSLCRPKCHLGTLAHLSCNHFYLPVKANETTLCLANGHWTPTSLKCVPVCGKSYPAVSLIVGGLLANPGAFPWQVAIYHTIENRREFWCAGSLVTEFVVLTAAHCTWKLRPENLSLVLGKFYRELNDEESHIQVKQAKKIEVLDTYQDVSGNYNGDLSLIFLMQPVELNNFVSPICLDWDQNLMDDQLKEGTLGTVVGWGLTENETFSDHLRVLKLPVVSDVKCIAEQERDFRKFVTYTSFCAGFRNGSGVCNGDSGGGLAFWDERSDRWYLQGVVSVSPRKKGTPFCDANYYTVFTKVSLFVKWLKKLIIHEGQSTNEIIIVETNTEKTSEPSLFETAQTKKNKLNVNDKRDPYGFIRQYFKEFEEYSSSGHEFNQNGQQWDFPHTKEMITFIRK